MNYNYVEGYIAWSNDVYFKIMNDYQKYETFNNYNIFVIHQVNHPFESLYSGYFGIGPSTNFKDSNP